MTNKIKKLHYRYSYMHNKQPWPTQEEVNSLNFNEFHQDIKKNTLVLSDTRGLHRRHPKAVADDKWRATLFCSFRSTPFTYY